jgi:hypothetical protein
VSRATLSLSFLAIEPRNPLLTSVSPRCSLTGDGLDDYLYINTNGAVPMWKNKGTIPPFWGSAQLIAAGPQKGASHEEDFDLCAVAQPYCGIRE